MKKHIAALAVAAGMMFAAGQAQAIDVERSATFAAPADKVWAAITEFCSIKTWHPAVVGCDLAEMGGLPKRTLHLDGGGEIIEVENFHSDTTMTITYSILESPLPVIEYWSTMTVTPAEGGGSELVWRGRFAAPEGQDQAASDVIGGIYDAGLDTLGKQVGM